MINPVEFVKMMRSNPQQMMQSMMGNNEIMQNPIMNNAINMYQNGDTQGLEQLVNNVARQKGTSVEEMRKRLGL